MQGSDSDGRVVVSLSDSPPQYRVIESKHKDYAVGDMVFGGFGWTTHSICNGDPKGHGHGLRKLDPSLPVSPSTALGILGMPG